MINVNYHSSIKIIDDKVLYFDPLSINEMHDADYIFITHSHWDHFSKDDILKVKKNSTIIIGPSSMLDSFLSIGFSKENIVLLSWNEEWSDDILCVKGVPSYNISKVFHPKENEWLGFLVNLNEVKYYVMGDTDLLLENLDVICDILFVPIGGTYTMNAIEASEFTNKICPKKVFPIHYGDVVGSQNDYELFFNAVSRNIEVINSFSDDLTI